MILIPTNLNDSIINNINNNLNEELKVIIYDEDESFSNDETSDEFSKDSFSCCIEDSENKKQMEEINDIKIPNLFERLLMNNNTKYKETIKDIIV